MILTLCIFRVRIYTKMTIDEGGLPSGGLSNYISGVFTERAQQEAEASRLKDATTQARLEQFIQVTSPLRTHLLQLAAPIEELLARFRVRELLEEACGMLDSQLAYKVIELKPNIYKQVVSNPQPIESVPLGNKTIKLDVITEPDNFIRLISQLEGYGLALSYVNRKTVSAREERRIWVEAKSSHLGWSVGGGDQWSTTPAHWSWDYFLGYAPVEVRKFLSVEAVEIESGHGYDLIYSHQLQRKDLRTLLDPNPEHHKAWVRGETDNKPYVQKDDDPQDRHKYLTPLQRIHAGDPVGVLQKFLGDDIIKELNGEYLDILRQFETKGTVRVREVPPAYVSNIPMISWIPFEP